ncbi:transcription factor GTE4 [Malania oleifera]|uniref:transcription factor GTE4 n=1 Tax=Malania oleifera TaxID=397392 RepID=UPI0025AEBE72|nr:transcription factor GTE4 [Malania oleifera]XP_057954692.1 transcription factor GTE4 [Malania oleifera]XP_057954693.1 transcription factor GTE4 [Malania oleifera]XP_057954694.1 transcription factor GTE4 [Malania oleifera]XP_057954695.1 transcription factor GTE4 [Malania oleifera]
MASGPIVGEGGGGGGDGAREKQRWAESKVYTRKAFKGPKKNSTTATATATATASTTTATTNNNNKCNHITDNNNKDNNNNSTNVAQPPQTLISEDANSSQRLLTARLDAASDDSSSLNRAQTAVPSSRDLPSGNGAVNQQGLQRLDNQIKISLSSKSKQEMRELRRKLENELDMVRNLVKKIEAKEAQSNSGFSHSHKPVAVNDGADNGGAKRVHSEVASVGPLEPSRPFHQLNMSVIENSQGVSDNVEKEKRTPKANQFYRNSEFLLGKEKFPPAESNKKSKSNGKKHGGGEMGFGFWMGKYFKSCSSLLERLMKHKHGWVFNSPVDVEGLGLHDYFSIIKHPMDLGTVKSRLNKNWYKSPREFAEDVRLTFHNAMTYNPKGQDVHVMAEQLLKIFEDRWAIIETDYNRELRIAMEYEVGLPTPTSRKTLPVLPLPPSHEMRRILDRSESMTHSIDPKPKSMSFAHSGRTPAPKKPKAKDPHKRDMTYEEKQKLSTNLQNLPSEKLDNIVQIIKKRNSALCQHDDEIEVDIDSVDAETLWELDRFVTNYRKSLSKNKRKAELAVQARAAAVQSVQETNPISVAVEAPKENKTDDKNVPHSSPVQAGKQADNASGSSSSSSSSSDSGSSSSDSESESSSADGSDAGHSPST